jgi:class 3 adenylate cyclase/tetratricopeptide (TPR) repeat protein/predicted Ser/Thr protein kinase
VGGFVVERLLGWGGMGVVYLARQPGLDRVVALKVIDPSREEDEGLRRRFERESRIAASIDHPHVLPIFESGEAEGVLYLAMRFVDGTDLRTVLAREGKLPIERATHLVTQLAGALDAAHERGLVHRDVKPANVLLAGGEPEHAYLTDFGVAKRTATATDLTRAGALIGSVDYVPPEQIQGRDIGPAADIYALGATLFHMLTGHPPHGGDSDAAVLQAHLDAEVPSVVAERADLPPGVDEVIGRAMARAPADRYPTAGAMARELADVLASTAPARRAVGATVVPTTDQATCPSCGAPTMAGGRFCAVCGVPLAARPPRETRRLVTVVRVELSGTTTSGQELDPERRRHVLTRARQQAADALERHGASVREEGRDALTALFGVAGVREDDALRAVRAATEVANRIDELNRELEIDHRDRIAARMGVSTGEVVVTDGADPRAAVEGEVVAVATRLAAQAASGEVLLGTPTETLVRTAVEAEPLALRSDASESAYVLQHVLEGAEAVPRTGEGPTVGRDRELDQLRDIYDRAVAAQRSALVTVLGSPGIGKSRLADDFTKALDEDVRVVVGKCVSYGGSAFWPLVDIVRELGGEDPVAGLTELIGSGECGIAAAAAVADALGLSERDSDGEQAIRGFVALFEALAERGPTVAVVEDIHWAETPLLDLIETIADEIRDLPLVLVCLSRPELLEARRAWGGGLTNAATISLEPLSRTESEKLVALLDAGGELDAESRARVVTAAEGNPLFIEQTVAYLRERGDLTRGKGLPATIHALLAARLDRLALEERALLSRAAVVGREFTRSALVALTPEDEREGLDDRLRALARRELIGAVRSRGESERGLRFNHVLICDTAYGTLPKHERSELHHRYATWLEASSSAGIELDEILGYHLERAHEYRAEVMGTDETTLALAAAAAGHLAAAAYRALARDDLRAGVMFLSRAAALPSADPQATLGLLAEMAPALVQLGDVPEAEAVLREIVRTVDPTPADPLDALALTLEPASGDDVLDAAIATAEEARRIFGALGDERHLAQVLLVIGDLHLMQCRATPAQLAYEEALPLARGCDDGRTETSLVESLSAALFSGPTPLGQAATAIEALIERARALNLVALCSRLLFALAFTEVRRGNAAAARRHLQESDATLRLNDSVRLHALISQLEGDLPLAEAQARENLAGDDRAGHARGTAQDATELGGILLDRGKISEARELFEFARDSTTEPMVRIKYLNGLAAVETRDGNFEAGERSAREAVAAADATEWQMHRVDAHLALAETLAAGAFVGDAGEEARLALELAEAKEYQPAVEKARALLGRLAVPAQS